MTMKPSSASTTAARLCAILLLIQATIVTSYCKASWKVNCDGTSRTAQLAITHYVNTEVSGALSTYNAEVIFHWGPENDVIEPAPYLIGSDQEVTKTRLNEYPQDGVYYVGYSVIFGEGAGCPGYVSKGWKRLTFDDETSDCEFEDVEDKEVPTWTTTNAPIIASSPTERPTPQPTTSSPTKNPTPEPTTGSPTRNPRTSAPSKQPIDAPTTSRPTERPTQKPTNEITNSPLSSITSNPTLSPTIEATPTNQGREQTEAPTLSATLLSTLAPVKTPASQTSAPVEPGTTPDGNGNGNVDNGGDANGAVEKPDDQGVDGVNKGNGDGGDDKSMNAIIGGVVGGVCILILVMAIGIYYTRRNRKEKETLSAEPSTTEMKQQQEQQQQQQADMMPNSNKPVMETQTAGVTEDDMIEPGALCFGTIESKEGEMDDVSKMSEWDFEGALNTGIDADNTVGESIISSQQKLFVYGVKKSPFGTDGMSYAGGSTINTGTIGSKGMVFGDDTTLEDIYNTPDGGGQSPSFQRMTVVAGPGKLGIVMDNPTGDLPLVHAIKESSPLNGKMRVGDLLLSVDEVDCRSMTAHKLSKILTSRSQNPTRTLVLARGSGGIQASQIR